MTEADYIVVGAGSGGCVLAGRLSEDPSVRVVLIEAGGSADGEIFDVPALWGRQFTTRYDWDYTSETEPHLGGRRNFLPRGKVLGGTSSMNAMVYTRGTPGDYDGWRDAGCPGWGWDDVLPYFKRAERNSRGGSELHGDGGPLAVADRISDNPLMVSWVAAAIDAGHAPNADFNGPDQEGVGFYQLTQHDGRRWSTDAAYLRQAESRSNLTVLTHTHVTKVLLDGTRAIGVETERLGERRRVLADREVILCAGAYNTPQLLLHSGIGPADHLRSMGIPVVADLPVGENLQDHPGVPLVVGTDGPTMFGLGTDEDWHRYRAERSGRLSSNVIEAGGFFRTQPDLAECDVQVVVQPLPFSEDGRGAIKEDGCTVVVEVLRPTSAGTVRLRSTQPTSKPRITHNHLATKHDRDTMAAGLRMHMEILVHAPIARKIRDTLRWPGSATDADLDDFMRRETLGCFHPSSTCAMPTVVDPELKVHGVTGLRAADASVMPTTIRGNPNSVVVMIGEKAADLIRGLPPMTESGPAARVASTGPAQTV